MPRYQLTRAHIQKALDTVAGVDADVARALERVGYPEPRRRPEGFETLLRVIVGQQLSIKAAATIHGRLEQAMGQDRSPARILRMRETTLRKAGLSQPKVRYVRTLARMVIDGELAVEALAALPDEDALRAIEAVPGLGRWSAQIYLMFSLGRPDIWPRGDIGLLNGLQKIKRLETRPARREDEPLVEPARPYRSALALLAWKCSHSPAL